MTGQDMWLVVKIQKTQLLVTVQEREGERFYDYKMLADNN